MDIPAYPETLWELLVQRSQATPDRVVVEDDKGRRVTASELRQLAERAAAGLAGRNVTADTVVSWQLPTTIDSCVLMLALARLGAVQNPIIPVLRAREVGFILAQTGAELLITPGTWRNFDYAGMAASVAAETGVDIVALDAQGGLPTGDPAFLPPPPTGEGNPVRHLYYSSGSTADPKGARHTDRSAMYSATGVLVGLEVDAEDCLPVPFPYTHIGGMSLTVASLYAGSRLLLIETFDPDSTPLLMGERGATLTGTAVPFYIAYMNAQQRLGDRPLLPRLKAFTGGGAPKPPELYYQMKDVFGVGIVSGYGLTEFPVATSCTIRDDDSQLAHTEGRPVPGVEVRIVCPAGQPLGPGREGEVRLKGPQVCEGYVDSTLDGDAFDEEGFFRTGDLGVVEETGHLRITGRLKDIIIRNAENISAQEIEDVLFQHPKIGDVAVVGLPDPVTGERACAVVVLADEADTVSLAEIAEFCHGHHLAKQKVPERVEVVHELPRNSLGKIMKRDLRDRLTRSVDSDPSSNASDRHRTLVIGEPSITCFSDDILNI